MKKTLMMTSWILIAGLLVSVANAQTPAPQVPSGKTPAQSQEDVKYPKLVVKEPVHDFGEVWAGTVLKHSFDITNTGDAPLEIIKVKPKCGCTVSGKYDKVIPVGKVSKLPFQLKTNRYNGKITKHITVTTNDPKQKSLKLSLVATVKPYILVNPKNGAAFSNLKEEETATKKIRLKNNTDKPVKLELVPYNAKSPFTIEFDEVVEGMEWDLVVTASPPYNAKQNRRPIKIKTDIPKFPELRVNCWANVRPRIDVSPSVLTIRAQMTRSIPKRITVTNLGETAVKVLDVKCDMPDLDKDIEILEIQEGHQYQISLSIPKDYNPDKVRGTMTITTNDEKKPTLEVPVQVHKIKRKNRQAVTRNKQLKAHIGKPMPPFVATTEKGETFSSAVLDGSILLLNFYTSDNTISKLQLPQIENIYSEYHGSDLKVLGICQDAVKSDAKATKLKAESLLRTLECRFDWVFDPNRTIGDSLPITIYPSLILVDKNRIIRGVWTGAPKNMQKEVAYTIAAIQRDPDQPKKPTPSAKKSESKSTSNLKKIPVKKQD